MLASGEADKFNIRFPIMREIVTSVQLHAACFIKALSQLHSTHEDNTMFGKIINDDHYQGIRLSPTYGPFLENRLVDALATINGAFEDSQSINMIIAGLKVSKRKTDKINTDAAVVGFVNTLRNYALEHYLQMGRDKKNLPKPIVDAIWQRVFNMDGSSRCSLVLLLNNAAYIEQNVMLPDAVILKYRIISAWSIAMNYSHSKAEECVHMYPTPAHIHQNTPEGLKFSFPWVSELCSLPRREKPELRMSEFGCTRAAN